MGKIIAVFNDKGGVAKTTTTINLGTALWLLGKKVLLVDTDQQGSLTQFLDKDSTLPDSDGCHTLYEWMKNPANSPINERYPGLDFVPSTHSMANGYQEFAATTGHEMILRKRLSLVKEQYDYILVDCIPGGKNFMNTNVLVAADELLVPMMAEPACITGIPNLMNFVSEVETSYDKKIKVLGFVITRAEPQTIKYKQIKEYFQSHEEQLGGPLLPFHISKCTKAAESVSHEMSLYEYAPSCTAADDYMRLAENLIGVTRRKGWGPQQWGNICTSAYSDFQKSKML